jgi:hypothetical protein
MLICGDEIVTDWDYALETYKITMHFWETFLQSMTWPLVALIALFAFRRLIKNVGELIPLVKELNISGLKLKLREEMQVAAEIAKSDEFANVSNAHDSLQLIKPEHYYQQPRDYVIERFLLVEEELNNLVKFYKIHTGINNPIRNKTIIKALIEKGKLTSGALSLYLAIESVRNTVVHKVIESLPDDFQMGAFDYAVNTLLLALKKAGQEEKIANVTDNTNDL